MPQSDERRVAGIYGCGNVCEVAFPILRQDSQQRVSGQLHAELDAVGGHLLWRQLLQQQ